MVVNVFNFLEEIELVAMLGGDINESGDVFGEAAAAIADAGLEEVLADAFIEADAVGNVVDITTGEFANAGNGVNEGDFGGEERIAGVFNEFGAFDVSEEDGHIEWLVDLSHNLAGTVVTNTDDHPVTRHKIFDGAAFAEEFGVADDVEVDLVDIMFGEDFGNEIAGSDGDGTFIDDNFIGISVLSNLLGCGFNVGEVGGTVVVGRSTDGDENSISLLGGFGETGGKRKAAGGYVFFH